MLRRRRFRYPWGLCIRRYISKLIDQKYISDYKKQTGERMVKVYYHLEDAARERLEALVSEYREFSQVMNDILGL